MGWVEGRIPAKMPYEKQSSLWTAGKDVDNCDQPQAGSCLSNVLSLLSLTEL